MADTADNNRFIFTASDNINGIALMVIARAVFAVSDSFTKLTGEGALPPTQVLTMRNAIALPIVLFLAWRLGGLGHIGTAIRNRALLWRSGIEGVGLLAFVIALPHVTLGQSTVLLLTMPIILVALSALIFKEDVGWRRWTAILVGFAGVFMVAGPLGGTPNYYLVLTMITAVTWAVRDLITSRIVGHIPSVTVTLFATLAGLAVSLPAASWRLRTSSISARSGPVRSRWWRLSATRARSGASCWGSSSGATSRTSGASSAHSSSLARVSTRSSGNSSSLGAAAPRRNLPKPTDVKSVSCFPP
jgi:drug/metabolite transporter (DMT)-like permease